MDFIDGIVVEILYVSVSVFIIFQQRIVVCYWLSNKTVKINNSERLGDAVEELQIDILKVITFQKVYDADYKSLDMEFATNKIGLTDFIRNMSELKLGRYFYGFQKIRLSDFHLFHVDDNENKMDISSDEKRFDQVRPNLLVIVDATSSDQFQEHFNEPPLVFGHFGWICSDGSGSLLMGMPRPPPLLQPLVIADDFFTDLLEGPDL